MDINKDNGFTLIETLISIILLAVILVGGMALYFNADAWQAMTIRKKLAIELASSEMENQKDTDFALIDNSVTSQSIDNTRYQTAVGVNLNPGYKEVIVNVSWTEPNQDSPKDVELTTYIAP